MKTYTLSDEVIQRLAQSLQECIIFGVDIVDIIRQMRLVEGEENSLLLSPEYKQQVIDGHNKALAQVEELGGKRLVMS